MSKEKLIKAKQGALMSLIDVMKGLQLEKMKGFKKKEDEKPAIEAEMKKLDPEMLAKAKEKCEEEDDE